MGKNKHFRRKKCFASVIIIIIIIINGKLHFSTFPSIRDLLDQWADHWNPHRRTHDFIPEAVAFLSPHRWRQRRRRWSSCGEGRVLGELPDSAARRSVIGHRCKRQAIFSLGFAPNHLEFHMSIWIERPFFPL